MDDEKCANCGAWMEYNELEKIYECNHCDRVLDSNGKVINTG